MPGKIKKVDDKTQNKADALAANYLLRYIKTSKELRDYLVKKGFSDNVAKCTVKKCEKYGYINDGTYAHNFAQFKGQSHSSKQIKFELKRKGIKDELIEPLQFNDRAAILNISQKYMAKKETTNENILKLKNSLARKGFGFDDISKVINANFRVVSDESWN